MAEREQNLPATFKLEKREIQLKQKLNLLQNIEIQSLKAAQREFIATQKELQLAKSPVKNNLAKALKDLLKAKKQLETDLEKAVQDPEKQAALTNIPGISSLGASLILNFLDLNCLSVKQWIAYTGLDISIRESGTWKGKGKLTKRGNAFLRKRCVAMAWGAIMHNKYFKALYTELRQRKRSYKEALCIIARKILRIAFTILKQNIPYNENILCQQN
uniref:Transposase IS116/IS110/IS902 family protein n=2 Tax=unclassified Candidatus Kentrum TaxID=2643149 RepID=A0A451B5U8_9GAMM|nr:MAG: Transposase IS116/IS110/IS902 family protein [Candidatus Kentron sp. UNK]